jgi:hypothetical protein
MHSVARGVAALSMAVALALPATVSAHIFKCLQGETVAYQSMPCGDGQTEVRVLILAGGEADAPAPPRATPPEVPNAQSNGRTWPPRRTLTLGMSDDEVLNLAGWGVPKHIARTRAARGWREEWTYATSNGERRLYFVNATLVDAIVDGNSSVAMAQVETARRSYPPS